jgi:hypothetical protein
VAREVELLSATTSRTGINLPLPTSMIAYILIAKSHLGPGVLPSSEGTGDSAGVCLGLSAGVGVGAGVGVCV